MPFLAPAALLSVFAAAVVLSLAASWDVTVGPLLRGIAQAIANAPLPAVLRRGIGLSALANAILAFEAAMRRNIGTAVGHVAWPLARLFRVVANVVSYPAREVEGLARDVGDALWNLRRTVIPAMIAAKVGWIAKHLTALERVAPTIVHRVTRVVVHDVPHFVKPTVINVARAVANPALPRIGRLEREAAADLGRLRDLAKRLAPAALAAAVAAAVARLGFSWVRCSRVNKAGRGICGMNDQMLDSLLADTALVVGTISLVEFAHGMQGVMDEITGPVRHFWRAD